jgi:hypothetical protein
MKRSDKHEHAGNVHTSLTKHQASVKRFYVIEISDIIMKKLPTYSLNKAVIAVFILPNYTTAGPAGFV